MGLLQQSQDPLFRVLFPADPEEKPQEASPGQSKAPVLTVVSKFKVGLVELPPWPQDDGGASQDGCCLGTVPAPRELATPERQRHTPV